jgi:hypothetical protein
MLRMRGAGLTMLGMILLCGCGLQKGETKLTYTRGSTPPPLKRATQAGEYGLYPNNSFNVVTTEDLAAGDLYGFRKRDDGSVVAVAKGQEIELPAKLATAYYWKLRKTMKE